MSFSKEAGYVPRTFNEVMNALRVILNGRFSMTYTEESFVGSSWYKYLYAPVQRVVANETRTAEIFKKLAEYISETNLRIQRPSVSLPGLLDSFGSRGFTVSVKQNIPDDAGYISVCVLLDSSAGDYAAKRLQVCELLRQFVVANPIPLGSEVETLVLKNGQSFDFKFFLPEYTPIKIRATITKSANTQLIVPSDETIRQQIFDNVKARYRLGWNFEPSRYLTLVDAPYAGAILFQWSDDDGDTWESTIHTAGFRDLFTFGLDDIEVLL